MFRHLQTRARCRALIALLVSGLFALCPHATRAQDDTAPADELPQRIIVSATRLPTPEYEVASSVTLITAADIDLPSGVEILNPDVHIATLDKKSRLELYLTIGRGRGYPVPPALSIAGPRRVGIRGLYVITDPGLRPDRSPAHAAFLDAVRVQSPADAGSVTLPAPCCRCCLQTGAGTE